MVSENDGDEMLKSQILKSIEYTRQKDTIITWCTKEKSQEVALSFQDIEDTKNML